MTALSPAARRPTIAVVIPLFNHAPYIEAAIGSVLAQTDPVDELLLIDDGSQDDGFARAAAVLHGRPATRLLQRANHGAHATLNELVGLVQSDFVAVLNSDDMFSPDKIERCRALLRRHPEAGLLLGGVVYCRADGTAIRDGPDVEWLAGAHAFHAATGLLQLSLLKANWVVTTSNMVFSPQAWRAARGFQRLRYCHDIDFLMAASACASVVTDPAHEHVWYRLHPRNTLKESPRDMRFELMAVIAATLCAQGGRLAGSVLDPAAISHLGLFLRDQGCGELMTLLQTLYLGQPGRAAFYEVVNDPVHRAALMDWLPD